MNSSPTIEEEEWIRKCQKGDKEAFGVLVRKYMKQAYYTALGLLGSHDDALDASQEAFVKAFRAINTFDSNKRFFSWYYKILKNHCLNILRDRKNTPEPLESMMEMNEPHSQEPTGEDNLQRVQVHKAVWGALWQMDADDRQLIVARDMLDTPYAKLAELLDCPVGTVMSRLFYARKRLRERLEGLV